MADALCIIKNSLGDSELARRSTVIVLRSAVACLPAENYHLAILIIKRCVHE